MTASNPDVDRNRRDARLIAFIIAGTMLAWMGAQWLGGRLGWEPRYAFLLDLAALATFFWALVVTYQIWRRHKAAHRGN